MAIQLPNPGLGDGQTGDNEFVMWSKTRDNFKEIDGELKRLSDSVAPAVNDIGIAGEIGFGVGVTNDLPNGMRPFVGTNIRGHVDYGNYYYTDSSVMVYVPAFVYRWGHPSSPNYAKYGVNALDVKSLADFSSESAANSAGYALHRAFYDGGEVKQGFFVDKFQCSNNSGVASSIKFAVPMSTSSANNPISGLTGSIANNLGGTIDAAKTRGQDFFPTTIFIQKALALLSMAHAQAATNSASCAWYDASGVTNYPKGCNNNALRDANDTSVEYAESGYSNMGKTGSGNPFAKTTHNGQTSGVADLNGNLWEVALGITVSADKFHVLKISAKASALTSGISSATDAWGATGVTANYDLIGESYGELTGESRNFAVGSTSSAVFSAAKSGISWAMDGAGVPVTGGAGGTNIFGNDRFYDNKVNDCCPGVGGSWSAGSNAGVWSATFDSSRASSGGNVGFRAALYHV